MAKVYSVTKFKFFRPHKGGIGFLRPNSECFSRVQENGKRTLAVMPERSLDEFICPICGTRGLIVTPDDAPLSEQIREGRAHGHI